MSEKLEESQLEKWLRARHMTTNRMVELVGCSRTVVWKVKKGLAICPLYAKRIYQITGGAVQPLIELVGRK
jgi:hypothetical protein